MNRFLIVFFLFFVGNIFSQTDTLHVSHFLPKKFGVYPFKAKFDSIYRNKNFEDDVPAFIDTVPDGFYIQYYEPIAINVKFDEKRIALIFQVQNNLATGNAFWFSYDNQYLYKTGRYQNGYRIQHWWMHDSTRAGMKDFEINVDYEPKYEGGREEIICKIKKYIMNFPSGNHTIVSKYDGVTYEQQIFLDSILILKANPITFELYTWKNSINEKTFEATYSNRLLVEKYEIGGDFKLQNSNLLENDENLIFKDWRNLYEKYSENDLINIGLIEDFLVNNSYFLGISKMLYNGNEIQMYGYPFIFETYESNYSDESPFIRLQTIDNKKQLEIYRLNHTLRLSKKQLTKEEVKSFSPKHYDSISKKNCVHFVENYYDTIGKLLFSDLHSYLLDTIFHYDDTTGLNISGMDFQQGRLFLSTDLKYPEEITVEGNLFRLNKSYFEEKAYYAFHHSNQSESNQYVLLRGSYDFDLKKITESVSVNYSKKELIIQKLDENKNEMVATLNLLKDGKIGVVSTLNLGNNFKLIYNQTFDSKDIRIKKSSLTNLLTQNLKDCEEVIRWLETVSCIEYKNLITSNLKNKFWIEDSGKPMNGKLIYDYRLGKYILQTKKGEDISIGARGNSSRISFFNELSMDINNLNLPLRNDKNKMHNVYSSNYLKNIEIEIKEGKFEGEYKIYDVNNILVKKVIMVNNHFL